MDFGLFFPLCSIFPIYLQSFVETLFCCSSVAGMKYFVLSVCSIVNAMHGIKTVGFFWSDCSITSKVLRDHWRIIRRDTLQIKGNASIILLRFAQILNDFCKSFTIAVKLYLSMVFNALVNILVNNNYDWTNGVQFWI